MFFLFPRTLILTQCVHVNHPTIRPLVEDVVADIGKDASTIYEWSPAGFSWSPCVRLMSSDFSVAHFLAMAWTSLTANRPLASIPEQVIERCCCVLLLRERCLYDRQHPCDFPICLSWFKVCFFWILVWYWLLTTEGTSTPWSWFLRAMAMVWNKKSVAAVERTVDGFAGFEGSGYHSVWHYESYKFWAAARRQTPADCRPSSPFTP